MGVLRDLSNSFRVPKSVVLILLNFKLFFSGEFVTQNTKKALYQLKTTSKKESHFDMINKLELSEYDFFRIINFCKKIKINFLSTPYDLKSLEILKKN